MIVTRVEGLRGCGTRDPGCLYLVTYGPAEPCGKLPLRLDKCPTCGHGIKQSRGWQWIDPTPLFKGVPCEPEAETHGRCPLSDDTVSEWGRIGLLWIGKHFYTTGEFVEEANRLGVSRKIRSVPRGFQLGDTLVACASLQVPFGKQKAPGIFYVFKPDAIEYVVRGDETAEAIQKLIDRGITPVKITYKDTPADNPQLNFEW